MITISKVRKFLNPALQTALFLLSAWFIWHHVFLNTAVQKLSEGIKSGMTGDHPFLKALLLASVMLLMGLNWITEARKWQLLVRPLESISLARAARAVLSGISLGFFTPNRIGEYPARSLILRKTGMAEGILVTMAGSMAQLLVTIMAGCFSLVFLIRTLFPSIDINSTSFWFMTVSLILLPLLLLVLYLNVPFLRLNIPARSPALLKRLMGKIKVFSIYRRIDLLVVLLLSVIRYLIFTTQFYLLLRFFGLTLSCFQAFELIAVVYLITTLIPSVALTELGIRGSVAIWVFALYQPFTGMEPAIFNAAILSASVSLWLINIGIPATVGSFLIFKLKFRKR